MESSDARALEILMRAYSKVNGANERIKLSHAIQWLQGKFYRPSRAAEYREGDSI